MRSMGKLPAALGLAAALIGQTLGAQATEFSIIDVLNVSDGFTATVFHTSSSNGGKSGTILKTAQDVPDPTLLGTYNNVSGAIGFTFDLVGGGSVTGAGNILFPGNNDSALIGTITYSFFDGAGGSGNPLSVNGLTSHAIKYLDWDYGIGPTPQPNDFALTGGMYLMTLWGAAGTPDPDGGGNFLLEGAAAPTLGSDIRFKLSPVPLPAALPLLLAALGGLGFAARRRRSRHTA